LARPSLARFDRLTGIAGVESIFFYLPLRGCEGHGTDRSLQSLPIEEEGRLSSTPSELVERFYHVVWNEANEDEARKILDAGFRFRASLGPELRGPGGFIAYMRTLRAALPDFVCTIEELITAPERAAARMSFRGTHRGRFFGVDATGREIRWNGAAFFKTGDGSITELWVLGDIEAVRRQLEPERPTESFVV
jgi:steroid delta-isomerase-like uncharacterized protein